MPQRLVRHDRPEIGAPDADVDDVANALAGVAFPLATADAIAEGRHLVQHGVDAGNHILAVNLDDFAFGGAESHVQNRALLRDVDLLAAKHGVDPLAQAGFFGQLQQQFQCLVGDAVLGIIEKNADCLGGKTLASLRVVGKQLAEMDFTDLLVVRAQGFPCGTTRESFQPACHYLAPVVLALYFTVRAEVALRTHYGKFGQREVAHGPRLPITRIAVRYFRTALFDSITPISSFQEFTNAFAPSTWSCWPKASMSMPALANCCKTCSQSPPSGGITAPTSP